MPEIFGQQSPRGTDAVHFEKRFHRGDGFSGDRVGSGESGAVLVGEYAGPAAREDGGEWIGIGIGGWSAALLSLARVDLGGCDSPRLIQ